MLTYALGRGLDEYDRCAVDQIVKSLAANRYRFSALVLGIVKSDPFQKRRIVTIDGEQPERRSTMNRATADSRGGPSCEGWARPSPSPGWRRWRRPPRWPAARPSAAPRPGAWRSSTSPTASTCRTGRPKEVGLRLRAARRRSSRSQPFKDDLLVLTGLAQHNAEALGDGRATTPVAGLLPDRHPPAQDRRGRHPRRASRSTRSPPRRSAGRPGCRRSSWASSAGRSRATATRAIAVPTRRTSPGGRRTRRWPRRSTPSWSSTGSSPPRHATGSPADRRKRELYQKSILDFVLDDAQQLRSRLGIERPAQDRRIPDRRPRARAADQPGRERRPRACRRPASPGPTGFPTTSASTSA